MKKLLCYLLLLGLIIIHPASGSEDNDGNIKGSETISNQVDTGLKRNAQGISSNSTDVEHSPTNETNGVKSEGGSALQPKRQVLISKNAPKELPNLSSHAGKNFQGHKGNNAKSTRIESRLNIHHSGLYLSPLTTKSLTKIMQELGYDNAVNPSGNEYPRLFVKNFPPDFGTITDKTFRNQLFIKIIAPLALKINQEIMAEREGLQAVEYGFEENKDFEDFDCQYLEELAVKYDVTTPFKDTRRCIKLLLELKKRVDIIPPSILTASAAINSDWGTSRIALETNNLFQTRNWYSQEGVISQEEPNEPYRFKIYKSLEDSLRDYALKLNSNINYEQFWLARQVARRRPGSLYGKRLDWALVLDSNLSNYAGLLDYTLTYYRFYYLDEATLEKEYEFAD